MPSRSSRIRDFLPSCRVAAGPAFLAGAACLLGCGRPELAAHWRDRELVVDGRLDEWAGMQTVLRGAGARVAVANDGDALFLSMETDDPSLAKLIAHRGLTVWFDPAGGEQKTLGVRFPLPAAGPPSRWGEIGGSRPGGAQLDNLELLGPQPFTRRELRAPGADGVLVAIGGGPGVLTYELRLPLAAAEQWGLGVGPGHTLGIGIEAKGMHRAPRGRRPGNGGPGEGPGEPGGRDAPEGGGEPDPGEGDEGGPPGRGPGPGGGQGGRGGRPGVIRDFEAWAVVRLAAAG